MRPIRRRIGLLGAAWLSLLVSCGGGGSTLSAGQFADKMNEICSDMRSKFEKIDTPNSVEEGAKAVGDLLDLSQKELVKVKDLKLSGDSAKTRDELASIIEKSHDILGSARRAATDGDEEKLLEQLTKYQDKLDEFRSAAEDAGLDECATDSSRISGDGSAAGSGSTSTTVATQTTAPARGSTSTSAAGIEYIDATTVLTPWPGATLTPIAAGDAQALTQQIASSDAEGRISAIGGAYVDAEDGSRVSLVFVEASSPFTADESQGFVTSVTSSAADLTEVDAHGLPGYTFTDADGTYGFVSVRPTTAVVAAGPTSEAVAAAVSGLLSANPSL